MAGKTKELGEKGGAELKVESLKKHPHPPVFAYVGETKELQANFLDVGETKGLGEKIVQS